MDPETFLDLFKKGVVCQKEALVNWDPVDKTVLANEQIDSDGKSWRSGAKVEKKTLRQWFIKSSVYAKSLSQALETLNSDDWELIKKIQKKWIGNCDGCFVEFKLDCLNLSLPVFTKDAYALNGVSHIFINKHNLLGDKLKTNELGLICHALNPFNGEKIPVYLKSDEDYGELNSEGRTHLDARLAIPSLNSNDKEFALKNKISFNQVINESDGKLMNSGEFNGLDKNDAQLAVLRKLRELNQGGFETSYKLNDWCISRQRKWGTPIPLVYCGDCGVVPVPVEDLPVDLPTEIFNTDQNSEKHSKLFETKCPKCEKSGAVRERDTMDTFVDSSWYFFRYLNVNNDEAIFDNDLANELMPVDVYIGGAEHAMTHLFVSRLVTHFFHDEKKINFQEPFTRFLAMGMIKGESYKTKVGKYVPSDLVTEKESVYYCKETNEELSKEFEKMSKSKLNGVDPEWMIERYGIDFTRLFLINFVHPKSDRNFSLAPDMIEGNKAIFDRLWKLTVKLNQLAQVETKTLEREQVEKLLNEMYKVRNSQLSMIEFNLTNNFNIPSYIVAANKMLKFSSKVAERFYAEDERFLKFFAETLIVFAPMIPHFASECWDVLKNKLNRLGFDSEKDLVEQKWPEIDPEFNIPFVVKKNNEKFLSFDLPKRVIEKLDRESAVRVVQDFVQSQNLPKKKIDFERFNSVLLESNLPFNLILHVKNNKKN